ncbi:MAG: hypothetical protein LQ340_001433 [Diploschistes diacapsis]|nr:MAG: hypothetical protein LQ340_001433 [Diploschistes diacapsis]
MSAGNNSTKDVINGFGGDKRRASTSSRGEPKSPTRYAGLMNQKRNSTDAAAAARRASWDDQKPAPGMLGAMWNKFTKGS